jgi:hypothetical protein
LNVDAFVLLGCEDSQTPTGEGGFREVEYSHEGCQAAVEALPAGLEALRVRKYTMSIFKFLAPPVPENGPKTLPELRSIKQLFEM